MPDISNLKGRMIFVSQFQRFQSIFLGSVDSGLVVRQNIMVAGIGGGGSCSFHGRWRQRKKRY
jgi:hypothetical protein